MEMAHGQWVRHSVITFDVDGTLVSSSPGWEEGAHGRSFTHAVNSVLMNNKDASAGGTIPQLLEKHEFHGLIEKGYQTSVSCSWGMYKKYLTQNMILE